MSFKEGDSTPLDSDTGITDDRNQSRSDENGSNEQTNLFIGDLSKDCQEEDIHRLFSLFGNVIDVQIKRSKLTKNPLGYGFVRMATTEEATQCLEQLNEEEVCGRPIRVAWAQRNSRLHVTNLDGTVTEAELNAVFSAYGEVVEVDTVITRAEGRSDAYALVHFVRREQAEEAKQQLNGTYVKSRAIYIDWNQNSLRRANGVAMAATGFDGSGVGNNGSRALMRTGECPMTAYQESPVVSIYVRFEVVEDDRHITDQALHQVFQKFGRVTVVAIKSNVVDPATNKEAGYAFVHYESSQSGREAATRAVDAVNGFVCEGVVYTAEFSRNFRRGACDENELSGPGYAYGSVYGYGPGSYVTEPNATTAGIDGALGHGCYAHSYSHSAMGMAGYYAAANSGVHSQNQTSMGMGIGMGLYGVGSPLLMPYGYPSTGTGAGPHTHLHSHTQPRTHAQVQVQVPYDHTDSRNHMYPNTASTASPTHTHTHTQSQSHAPMTTPYSPYYMTPGLAVPMMSPSPYPMPMGYGVGMGVGMGMDPSAFMVAPGTPYSAMMSNAHWPTMQMAPMSPHYMSHYTHSHLMGSKSNGGTKLSSPTPLSMSMSMPYSGGYVSDSTSSDSHSTLLPSSLHMSGGDLFDMYHSSNNDL